MPSMFVCLLWTRHRFTIKVDQFLLLTCDRLSPNHATIKSHEVHCPWSDDQFLQQGTEKGTDGLEKNDSGVAS